MENVKKNLSKWFSRNELSTLKAINNICPHCNKECGTIVKLNECDNNIIMCFECLDTYYDSCDKNYMFNCPCCENVINSYEIINHSK